MSNVLSDSQVQAVAATTEDRKYKLARFVCCSVYIGFALLEAWSTRQFINPDGISYLDMSDALLKHNWRLLINPLWSPLYPFLIGVATWITRPSAQWELPIVHMVNLVIFLGALWSFDFLLRQVICVLGRKNEHLDADSTVPLPAWSPDLRQEVSYLSAAWYYSWVGLSSEGDIVPHGIRLYGCCIFSNWRVAKSGLSSRYHPRYVLRSIRTFV